MTDDPHVCGRDCPPASRDPLGVDPGRVEPRGEPPAHPALPECPPGPVALAIARRLARERLDRWKAAHPE
jgi:hypothetical protein